MMATADRNKDITIHVGDSCRYTYIVYTYTDFNFLNVDNYYRPKFRMEKNADVPENNNFITDYHTLRT